MPDSDDIRMTDGYRGTAADPPGSYSTGRSRVGWLSAWPGGAFLAQTDAGAARVGASSPLPSQAPQSVDAMLVLVGAGLSLKGKQTFTVNRAGARPVDGKPPVDYLEAIIDIPDLRALTRFDDAARELLRRQIKDRRLPANMLVVRIDTAKQLRQAVASAKGKYRRIVWLGHDDLALGSAGGLPALRSTGPKINKTEVIPREEFIGIVRQAGAEPDIQGCYGSEGPGDSAGHSGMFGLDVRVELTQSGLAKIRSKKMLGPGDFRLLELREREKSDIEQFIETLPVPGRSNPR